MRELMMSYVYMLLMTRLYYWSIAFIALRKQDFFFFSISRNENEKTIHAHTVSKLVSSLC